MKNYSTPNNLTVDTEFPAASTITDNFANPSTTSIMSMLMVWDGAAWDRLGGDSTDGVYIQGSVSHDGVDSGKPIKMGARARSTPISAVSNNDRTDLISTLYGELVIAGYNYTDQSLNCKEIDPISDHHVEPTLVEVTNGTDGTYYYYVDMDSYKNSGYQLELSGGSGSVTVTFDGSMQDDGTSEVSVAYQDVTMAAWSAASFTSDDILVDGAGVLGCCKWVRIKVVASTGGANDADWSIYHKRLY